MKHAVITLLLSLLVMTGCTCHAPQSVKQADKEAQRLTTAYVSNSNTLFKRVADLYKKQEYKHIKVAADKALLEGAKPEALTLLVKEAQVKVDANYVKMLKKYLEIQTDLKQATLLRAEISKFMENKVNYGKLADVVLQFGEAIAENKGE
tara:strand:+ start:2568 stop:3017 length:450 start_codon:yes stop_codon:yes gene_type:complete